jgi:hypothetical protein
MVTFVVRNFSAPEISIPSKSSSRKLWLLPKEKDWNRFVTRWRGWALSGSRSGQTNMGRWLRRGLFPISKSNKLPKINKIECRTKKRPLTTFPPIFCHVESERLHVLLGRLGMGPIIGAHESLSGILTGVEANPKCGPMNRRVYCFGRGQMVNVLHSQRLREQQNRSFLRCD